MSCCWKLLSIPAGLGIIGWCYFLWRTFQELINLTSSEIGALVGYGIVFITAIVLTLPVLILLGAVIADSFEKG